MASMSSSNKNPIPAYYNLQVKLQNDIEQGVLVPGEQIPTERQLALEYHLSVGTVKKAFINLVNEGYLYRIQGKGTFVAGTERRRKHFRYYKMLRNLEDSPANIDINFLSIEQISQQDPDRKDCNVFGNQTLFKLRRLFRHKNNPLILTVSMLPAKMFPDLDKQDEIFFNHNLLYIALEQSYGVTTVANQELFSATSADQVLAEIFGVKEGHPLLYIEMLSFTYRDKPYEYRKAYCLTDDRKIEVRF